MEGITDKPVMRRRAQIECETCVAENYELNAEKRRQYQKDRYWANRSAEIERLQRWRAEHPERSREIVRRSRAGIRARRRAAGMCAECGAKPEPGYKTCPQCLERDAQRKLSRRARDSDPDLD